MDSHTITELVSSWGDMGQSKTDEVIQQNEQTSKLSGNESILCPIKRIKKKKKRKKNIDEQHITIKNKKNKPKKSVLKNIYQGLVKINDSVDYGTVSTENVAQISSGASNETERLLVFE